MDQSAPIESQIAAILKEGEAGIANKLSNQFAFYKIGVIRVWSRKRPYNLREGFRYLTPRSR